MAIITNSELRAAFLIPESYPDGPIDEAVALASRVVSKFITSAVYDDAILEDPVDPIRKTFVRSGELRIAMYYVLGASSPLRPSGLVKKEADAGLGGGTVDTEYLSPKDVDIVRAAYAREALDLLNEYKDPIDGVFILDAGGIEMGTVFPADFEPEILCYET